ncbi:MAG: HNH endonuclease [Bacteroidetes bacterium]|nr:HNH endonuclease [Bacteroidota bacterium]MCL6099455.1 HNH endonuclease [Bacteroidota bacterium]
MPDKDVQTIRDLIFYQYSKIIARSAFNMHDGRDAKKSHYGFIKKTFSELKSGKKSWSSITREDWQFVELIKKCIYCGAMVNLQAEHIVPKSIQIKPGCEKCDHLQGIHNQVWACVDCNSSKGTLGLYQYFKKKNPDNEKYYDSIPSLLEKKYLKTIYNCHDCAGTLTGGDIDGDGKITVLDLDYVIH